MRAALAAVVALGLATTATACHRGHAPAATQLSTKDAGKALIDRNWMDSWPEHKDDRLRVYRFTPSMGGGVFQDRKVFKGQFELFRYVAEDGTIDFDFPDTDEHIRSSFLIERVRGHDPFDLKLVIAHDPRGPGIYWSVSSMRGATLDPALAPSR